MQFRRSGQRDERRRRSLIEDDKKPTDTATSDKGREKVAARAYSPAALDAAELRLSDLIPTSPWTIAIVFLTGLAAVVGVQTLFTQLETWQQNLPHANLRGLDVTHSSSLHGWLSSMLLGMCSLACIGIYTIRRHKEDDYRGRYRLWLWGAAFALIASIETVAGLRDVLRTVATQLSGTPLMGDGTVWWLGTGGLIFGLLAVWMAIDMLRSRGSVTLLTMAIALYATTITLSQQQILLDATLQSMTISLTTVLGHLCLLYSLTLYARHVLFDARGLLPAVAPRKKKEPKVAPERKKKEVKEKAKPATASTEKTIAGKKIVVDPPHTKGSETRRTDVDSKTVKASEAKPAETKTTPPAAKSGGTFGASISKSTPTTKPAAALANAAANADDDDDDDDSSGTAGLSRAERKRLKKLQRRG